MITVSLTAADLRLLDGLAKRARETRPGTLRGLIRAASREDVRRDRVDSEAERRLAVLVDALDLAETAGAAGEERQDAARAALGAAVREARAWLARGSAAEALEDLARVCLEEARR